VRPDECEVIADASERLVQGASLRSLALDLRKREVPTVTGTKWSAETLRCILMRPRNAGLMVYRGEEIGDAPWKDQAPVPLETFRAVQRVLTDPDRRVGPGAAPKWLGTNIYCCGICTDAEFTHRVGMNVRLSGRTPVYRCKEQNHLVRQVEHVDKFVIGTILARLSLEDAADLLVPAKPEVDVAKLRSERAAIRTNLDEMAADKALGLIDRAQLLAGTQKGKARLEQIEAELQAAIVDSPLKPLIGAEDVQAEWEKLQLSHQRLVIDTLVNVRILPRGRGGSGFEPSTVEITWKDQSRPATPKARIPRQRSKPRAETQASQ
jgi:site-specific DNA recombinase